MTKPSLILIPALIAAAMAGCGSEATANGADAAVSQVTETTAEAPDDWTLWPVADGDWSYTDAANPVRSDMGSAQFTGSDGTVLLSLSCNLTPRRVAIALTDGANARNGITVHTSAGSSEVTGNGDQLVIPVGENVLDRIAFSRGFFAIRAAGQPMTKLPVWPELTRVIEDCRG